VRTTTVLLYVAKMVLYGIVLYFVITSDKWNVILAFVGILSYRIVLFPVVFFTLRKQKKDGDQNVGL